MPISIWVRKLNCKTEPRCLVVMEPVERTVAMVTFNNKVSFFIVHDDHGHIKKVCANVYP